MLMNSGPKKILICAPSNAAIDEIVSRVAQRGFVGQRSEECKNSTQIEKMLLRIGSMEYEPSPIVKKHTMDAQLVKKLHGDKIYQLRARIRLIKELLAETEKPGFTAFSFDNLEHRVPLQRLVFENYRKLKEWLNKKTPSEQVEKVKRELSRDESYLSDLENTETMK